MQDLNNIILGHSITPRTISVTFGGGRPVIITNQHLFFEKVAAKLRVGDKDGLWDLMSIGKGIQSYFKGQIEVRGDGVFHNGERVISKLVPIIMDIVANGGDPTHFLRFLLLLSRNPYENSRKQFYDFLERNGCVIYTGPKLVVSALCDGDGNRTELGDEGSYEIDPTGWVLMYKGVNDNLTDWYSNRFLNKPGTMFTMDRKKVNDNVNIGCASGFHNGCFEYVAGFGSRKLLTLVNPQDVVSVPNDCNYHKVRAYKYYVMREVDKGTFSPVIGSAFTGKTVFQIAFLETSDDVDPATVDIEADDQPKAIEKFKATNTYHEIVGVKKISG